MEPEPPPVTFVDPLSSGTPDLLSSGRDPWRPSRKQVAVTTSVVAMTALVASTAWLVVSKVRDERADRRDVRAMAFSSYVLPDNGTIRPPDTVRLELLNKGPDHVRVLDVRVDAPGYATIRVDDTVGRNGGLIVTMPTTTTACLDSLYTHGPRAVIVRARTARGTGVTVRAPLADEFEGQLWSAARQSCGIVLVDEALSTDLTDIAWRGGAVTATFALANSARIPLTIDTVTSIDGVAVDLEHLPLTLPAATAEDRPGRGRIVLHLRVVGCAEPRNSSTQPAADASSTSLHCSRRPSTTGTDTAGRTSTSTYRRAGTPA